MSLIKFPTAAIPRDTTFSGDIPLEAGGEWGLYHMYGKRAWMLP